MGKIRRMLSGAHFCVSLRDTEHVCSPRLLSSEYAELISVEMFFAEVAPIEGHSRSYICYVVGGTNESLTFENYQRDRLIFVR